ncbi:MAG: AsmA-like C-terminal region-containing protein, partial [Thermoanaerobaculia bacterium]
MNATQRTSPGRLRRWLVRPVAWLLLAVVVLAAALLAILESDWLAARGRDLLVSWLSAALEREVRVGSLEVEWLPLRIEAREMAILGEAADELPFATARKVVLEADPRRLLGPQPVVERLRIEGPWARLAFAQDGSHNLPLPARRGPRVGSRRIVIESLEVVDGEVVLDERRLPLELTARRVIARLVGDGPVAWVGTAAAQEVETRVAGLAPYLGGLALKLRLDSGALRLIDARVSGPDLALRATGDWRWGERREIALDLEVEASGALLDRLEWSDLIQGPLHFTGRFGWTPETWGVQGRLDSSQLVLDGRPLTQVQAELWLDEEAFRLDPLTG